MQKTKILIIHNILWTHYKSVLFESIEKQSYDNMELCVLQIAKNELSRKSMEGSIFTYNYKYVLLFNDYIENVPTFRKISGVFKFINSYNPDIVNVTGFAGDLSITLAIFYSFLKGKKIVISNESTMLDQKKSFFKRTLKKIIFSLADGFIVFGKSSKKYLLNLGVKSNRIIEEKAAVVDDRLIQSLYKKAKDSVGLLPEIKTKFNFIYVGRIIEIKQVDFLVSAFQNLKENIDGSMDWGLILVGNGEDDNKILELIKKSPKDIYKFDAVNWDAVPLFLAKSNCLVLPSISEPWGLVVNEAMVCGLAVIVSDACGCKDDLIQGNGYVFDKNSEEDLKIKMKSIINNHFELFQMQEKSKEIISEFKVEHVAQRILKGFQLIS